MAPGDDLPSFTGLFGPIEKAEGHHARSVLSPAAYLVDLLQLRDSIASDIPGGDPNGFHARRPDVGAIPLDETHTFEEAPYLEISNAAMKALAERDAPGGVDAKLASAVFPAPLPFDINHARLRLFLEKLGTNLDELYRLYPPEPGGHTIARLRLGLSEPEYNLFVTKHETDAAITALWGIRDDAERAALLDGDLSLVRRKLGLSIKELKALFYQDLDNDEIAANVAAGFFINRDPEHPAAYITIDPADKLRLSDGSTLRNRHLDRLMRFVRLAKHLRIEYSDLDWILQSIQADDLDADAVKAIAIAVSIKEKHGLPFDEVSCLWGPPKKHGRGDGPEPRDLFDRIFNHGYATPIETVAEHGLSEPLANRLLAALRISRADYDLLSGALAAQAGSPPAYIAALYRMVALAKMLSLSAKELLTLIDVLDAHWSTEAHPDLAMPIPIAGADGGAASQPGFHALTSPDAPIKRRLAALQRLLRLKGWSDNRQLSVRQLAFICLDRFDDGSAVDGVMDANTIEMALGEFAETLLGMLLKPSDLQSGSLSAKGAQIVFDALCEAQILSVVADAGTPSPKALSLAQPSESELLDALQKGIAERLEIFSSDFAAAGVPAPETQALIELLTDRGYVERLEERVFLAPGLRGFFLNRANLPNFYLPEFSEQIDAVFGVLAEKAEALARAEENIRGDAIEMGDRLRSLVEQHERALQRILAGQLALADDLVHVLFHFVFGMPGEPPAQTLASLTLPLIRIKQRDGASGRALSSAYLAAGFRRLQQFALILRKTGLTAAEAQVYFENQRIHRLLPELLKLPSALLEPSGQIDAITTLPNGDILVLAGQMHARFSPNDYRLLGVGDRTQIPGVSLPESFLKGIDRAFKDSDGVTYFISGEEYVSSAEPQAPKRISDKWGKVHNRIQQDERIDAALSDDRGRVFLFRGDQYVRYTDPRSITLGDAFVDEGYPKSVRRAFDAEQVVPLPSSISTKLDAAFRDADGSYYFFSGDKFTHSTEPYILREIRSRWGRVHNRLFDDNRADAAFVRADHTYLLRGDQLVRYTGGEYGFADEGYPISFANIPGDDAQLGVLKRFPGGVHAALMGADGVLYAFRDGDYAGSDEPDTMRPIAEHWGRVRNHFIESERVDAALFHDGAAYLFSGDQYVRYTGADYHYVDEGYPKRVRENWNQVERIGVLPPELPEPISAVVRSGSGEVFFFGGSRFAGPDGRVGEVAEHWGRVRNNIEQIGQVDAALIDSAGKLYLFAGDQFYRYSSPGQEFADEGYPRSLTSFTQEYGAPLPEAFAGGISAALRASDGRIFFFGGDIYARVDAAGQVGFIRSEWGLVRNVIAAQSRVNAAFRDPQGRTYLFGGDQFVRYSGDQYDFVDEGFPQAIGQKWGDLPEAFRSGIDAALCFPVDGVDRVYLFKGREFVRYSSSDYSRVDDGYPKRITDGDESEGRWFRGFAEHAPDDGHHHHDAIHIDAVYVDSYRGQPRICLFYTYSHGPSGQWKREYRFDAVNRYRWMDPQRVESPGEFAPFTRLDAAFVAKDGTLHVFSGTQCASRAPQGGPLSQPVPTRDRWARVHNQFADPGRVDAALSMPDGRTYLFCDQQFVRYSGEIRPGAGDFFVDEGYPKKIAPNWGAEGVPIPLASGFLPAGHALFCDAGGTIHFFDGPKYIHSGDPGTPALVKERWGRIENRLQELNRVDAAYTAENDKLYLFCDDQYTRYSTALQPGVPEFYSDEGYPKRIATNWAAEGLSAVMPAKVAALGHAILRDANETYVFAGDSFTTSSEQAPRPIVEHWAKVRNQIQIRNGVDAGFVLRKGDLSITFLFCGDQYVRYSGAYSGFVDEGYPKRIAILPQVEGISPLPDQLEGGLCAAFAGRDDHIHAFTRASAPGEQQLYACSSDADLLLEPRQKWGIVENKLFDNGFVNAALLAPNKNIYLFSGDQYIRYSEPNQEYVDEGYPRKVVPSFAREIGAGELPAIMAQGVNAALAIGDIQYFFVDDQYVASDAPGTARLLVERWGRVDNRLQQSSRIDAGFVAPDGKLYLFTGDQYTLYSGADRTYADEGHPKNIAENIGKAWPEAFQKDLGSACAFEGRSYLFKGADHVRISDLRLRNPDGGYPRPIIDKFADRRDFTLGTLPSYWDFKDLSGRFGSPPCTILQYLQDPVHGAGKLASTTQWSETEIAHLLASAQFAGADAGDIRVIAALARYFSFADRLGSTPSNLGAHIWDKAFGETPRDLAAAADLAFNLVKAKTGAPDWPVMHKAMRDPLNAALRDALVAHLVHSRGLGNADDLYEYLLNDVRMGESATTSRIVEAIGSVQLYYHRALMNLEEVPSNMLDDLKRWWPWMKNYRIWEANRKVFLYPENYIRPELRTIKSPGFEELEQNLLQDEINAESVGAAYTTYIERFSEVSRLRIAGGYIYRDERGDSYVIIFGFARTEPLTYYHRLGRLPDDPSESIAWHPWRKINITINAEQVRPVYTFNRIFLFWLEQEFAREMPSSGDGGTPSNTTDRAQPVLKYSFMNANGEWIQPQTIRAEVRRSDGNPWTASEVKQGQLYVTNPSIKSDYDPNAYNYVLLSLPNIRDTLVGRLTAALDFEPRSAIGDAEATALTASIDMAASFPSRLGIRPDSAARWGSHFRGIMTAPWFSFEASGGSFLCRPHEPAPITLDAIRHTIEINGRTFSKVDAAFSTAEGEMFVFTSENGRVCYHHYGSPEPGGERSWRAPVCTGDTLPNGEPVWPWGILRGLFEQQPDQRIQNVIAIGGTTFFMTASHYFTYSTNEYRFIDQRVVAELVPGAPPLDLLVRGATEIPMQQTLDLQGNWPAIFDSNYELAGAFKYDQSFGVLVKWPDGRLAYAMLRLSPLRSLISRGEIPNAPVDLFSDWTALDTIFTTPQGQLVFTRGRSVVLLDWATQTWSASDLGVFQVNEPGLSAAFTGSDGALYFICGDRYAEITPSAAPVFRPVAEKWGRFSPLFPGMFQSVGAALIGPDGTLYLFCGAYCLRYPGFHSASPPSSLIRFDAPQATSEIWGDALDVVTAGFNRGSKIFLFGKKDNEARYARYSPSSSATVFTPDPGYPKRVEGEWGNLPTTFNWGFDAAVERKGDNGGPDELILTRAGEMIVYGGATGRVLYEICEVKYAILRLSSNTAERFSQNLLSGGISKLLSLDTQRTQELPRFTTSPAERRQDVVICEDTTYLTDYPGKPSGQSAGTALDFESANGFYYWEIFFHIPYLVAQALNEAQRFEEAKSWYEHVFDPTENNAAPGDRPYWKFLPFHDASNGSGPSYLEDPDQLKKYRDDPFDPHGLAQLRPIAYRKAFVMSYIDNLLDWGDMLFQQFTRESVGEATMLYVLAADLLGKPPEEVGKPKLALATMTYDQLRGQGVFESKSSELFELENLIPAPGIETLAALDGTPNDTILNAYFFIPENSQFIDYWSRVGDRLNKIRSGLDIEGLRRSLALLEPPVDVAALVQAFTAGAGMSLPLSDYNAVVPHYRFSFMLGQAQALTQRLIQLGGALLSALEKQDAEELGLLRNTQERTLLEMTLDIKQQQLESAVQSVLAQRAGLRGAQTREAHYGRLLAEGLSPFELLQLIAMFMSQGFSVASSLMNMIAGTLSAIPTFSAPMFSVSVGGPNIGAAMSAYSLSIQRQSEFFTFIGTLAAILGGWHRRAQDWELQRALATHDVEQIRRQIKAAEIQVEVARREIQAQRRQIQHNLAVDAFLKSKFTSRELYRWMAGKLAAVYFQTYQMALDYAKAAQRALQFEMGWPEDEARHIGSYYWDSLKKGLLAGEQLQLDLDRLEKAFVEKNRRRLEVTKTISLLLTDPFALLSLIQKGSCEFELSEALFDYDFPGHYCRQIKTVAVSFPAVVGPYENFNATLTQLSHRTVLRPDINAIQYLLTAEGDAPASIRADWRANQQVALSRGVNDSGLFQLNYQDERYLPFEGTGAVSRWRLQINGADGAAHREHLRDVILTLQYTALPGGDDLAEKVKNALPPVDRARMLNLALDFPEQWQAFMLNPSRGLKFKLEKSHLPWMTPNAVSALYLHYELTESGTGAIGRQSVRLNGDIELSPGSPRGGLSLPLGDWTLVPTGRADQFTAENIKSMMLLVTYSAKPIF